MIEKEGEGDKFVYYLNYDVVGKSDDDSEYDVTETDLKSFEFNLKLNGR